MDKVWAALHDPNKHVVVQPAPAVRVALGEEFGMPMGTQRDGKNGGGDAPNGLR